MAAGHRGGVHRGTARRHPFVSGSWSAQGERPCRRESPSALLLYAPTALPHAESAASECSVGARSTLTILMWPPSGIGRAVALSEPLALARLTICQRPRPMRDRRKLRDQS